MNNFQKYFSYLNRIIVEKTTSDFNKELIVAIQDGKYVLNTKNANYSYASLHRVFQQALAKIEMKKKKMTSVLVLGCGAGSIPTIIYKELNLNPQMDAVEIDEKVIELGNKYFGLNQFSNLNIIINDASKFVETTDKKYDLILVDLFKGIDVPEKFLSQHFFKELKSLLNPNGELLLNYVAYNYDTKERVKNIQTLLGEIFDVDVEVYKLETINRIFRAKNKRR